MFTLELDKQFSFLDLTQLIHFQFSGCYCKDFLTVMKAFPLKQLVHLDISNNIFTEYEIYAIIDILKDTKLESLILPDNVSYYWYPPKLTGEVLHLSNLKGLDLIGNIDMESFSEELSKITSNSEL